MNDLAHIHFDYFNGGIDTEVYKTKEEQDRVKREILFRRFEDIYLESPYILAHIMYEENNPILNEYITRRTGIVIDGEKPSQRHRSVSILMDLEDHFVDHFISLYDPVVFFTFDLAHSDCYLLLKEKIKNQDNSVGENIYDLSMRTLLNIVYQYIRSQGKNTRVYNVFNSIEVSHRQGQRGLDKSYVSSDILLDKLNILEKFLQIANYRNCNEGILMDDDLPDISAFFGYHKKTLVGSDVLKEDLDSLITEKDIEDFYFKYHKEMKWDELGRCQSNDIFKDNLSCGDEFHLSENNIFHLDGHFYQMCPNCGCITDVSSSIKLDEVKNRIINRTDKDEQLLKKSSILSELYYLDKDYKVLLKK